MARIKGDVYKRQRFYRIEWYRMINPNSWHIDGEIVDNSYTVTFMVDGNVYQEVREVKGTEVSVTDPVKAETETTTYEFTGWTLEAVSYTHLIQTGRFKYNSEE